MIQMGMECQIILTYVMDLTTIKIMMVMAVPDGCDEDDDNDGLADLSELQSYFGFINYDFFDGTPTDQTINNIPISGATAQGLTTDFNVDQLATDLTGSTTSYSIRYNGRIYLAESADYTFYLSSDDGSSLSLNGEFAN